MESILIIFPDNMKKKYVELWEGGRQEGGQSSSTLLVGEID